MHLILRKNWHNEKRTYQIVPFWVCFFVLSLIVWSAPAFGYNFEQVIDSFETDFDRVNPIKMRGRFESIIRKISGMEIGQDVRITFRPRGDVKHELFVQDMKKQNLTDEYKIAAYEYVLKQLRLIEGDHSFKDILLGSLYDNMYGFYSPSSKDLVIIEGTGKSIEGTILFHELVHAAQDWTIDLNEYYERHSRDLDCGLAASALVEGQAAAVELIVQIEQNLQNKTRKEILETILAQMVNTVCYPESEQNDFLSMVNTFPYYSGLRFVLQRYLNDTEDFTRMFENVPSSTEQILHPEKFYRNERPVETILERNKAELLSLAGTKLMFDTTLGEYHIRHIFCSVLKTERKRNENAASGWGGDRMFVLRSNGRLYFIWDTSWDSVEDAREFYECYLDFSKCRFKARKLHPHDIFDATLSKDKISLFLKRDGNRVVIIEGGVPPSALNSLIDFLRLKPDRTNWLQLFSSCF
jgi:hypothetical protein